MARGARESIVPRLGDLLASSLNPAAYSAFLGGVQQGFDGFRHNPVDDAAAVRCPTLVLHGDRDRWVTSDEARAVLARVQGPKQLVEVPGAGHELLILAAPKRWNEAVTGFLGRLNVE